MAKPFDFEAIRQALADQRQHIAIGKITQLGLAPDRSCLRLQVLIFDPEQPEDREIIAVMSWDDVGANCGNIRFPSVNDMVLVAMAYGDPDHAYVIKRLTSKQEKLPFQAVGGHTVQAALAGKKLYLQSDTRINLGKPGDEPASPLVLGDVLKTLLDNLYTQLDNIITKLSTDPLVVCSAPGQPGVPHPTLVADLATIKTALDADKTNLVDTAATNILSQTAFTER